MNMRIGKGVETAEASSGNIVGNCSNRYNQASRRRSSTSSQNGGATTIISMKTQTILNSSTTFSALLLLLCLLDGVFLARAAPSSPLMVMMSGHHHSNALPEDNSFEQREELAPQYPNNDINSNSAAYLIDFSRLFDRHGSVKREEPTRCHPTEPFQCPSHGLVRACISIQYLCDGARDCPDGYDEDSRLCTAAKRPPVEETSSILKTLLSNHGPNYLEKLFGKKARDALAPLGGVQRVAVALSESETLEDFGKALHLMRSDLEHLRNVLLAVESGDSGTLRALGVRDSELGDVKLFLDKLVSTGFMD